MKYIIILKLKSVFCLINVFVFQLNDQTEANHKSDLPYGGLHLTDDDINFILSDDYAERNELQVVNYESEECSEEFVNGLIADPDEISYNETTSNLFNDSSLPASQKRSYFMDAPYGSDTDAEGVSARVNTRLTFYFSP